MSAPQERPGSVVNAPTIVNAPRAGRRVQSESAQHGGGDAESRNAASQAQPKALDEVKEFIQQFVVAEKNYQLYPSYSKVVKHSIEKLYESLEAVVEKLEAPLQLRISQKDFLFEDIVVYHEEHKGKSLAYRLYTDGVRAVAFLEEIESEELVDFLDCFKCLRDSDSEDDDFGTVFWEKDCAGVQLQIVDDTDSTSEEDIPEIPTSHLFSMGFDREQLDLDPEEEQRLREELAETLSSESKNNAFELSDEESEKIRALAREEEAYFPVYDFVDVLLELMIKNGDEEAFKEAAKMIRSIIFALVENLDFHHAAALLRKLSKEDAHPGLTHEHKQQIREMVGTFCDKDTVQLIDGYLNEHPKLPADHGLFEFLTVFDGNAVRQFCPLLKYESHGRAIIDVLEKIGTNSIKTFESFLDDPDPNVVKSIILLLSRFKDDKRSKRISQALRHPNEEIRKHAAKVILEIADRNATEHLLPLLDESSPDLLHFAVQFFLRVPSEEIYEPVFNLINSPRFNELDKAKQAQTFQLLIAAKRDEGLDYVRNKVLRWRRSLTKAIERRKGAAVLALADVDDEESIALLTKLSEMKRSELASTARHALRLMRTRAEKNEHAKELEHVH